MLETQKKKNEKYIFFFLLSQNKNVMRKISISRPCIKRILRNQRLLSYLDLDFFRGLLESEMTRLLAKTIDASLIQRKMSDRKTLMSKDLSNALRTLHMMPYLEQVLVADLKNMPHMIPLYKIEAITKHYIHNESKWGQGTNKVSQNLIDGLCTVCSVKIKHIMHLVKNKRVESTTPGKEIIDKQKTVELIFENSENLDSIANLPEF